MTTHFTASEMIKTTKEANDASIKEFRQGLRDWAEGVCKEVLVALKKWEDENRPRLGG